MKVAEFKRRDLVRIDVLCGRPKPGSRAATLLDECELANEICRVAAKKCGHFAADYDGPIGEGDPSTDFNVLVLARDMETWRAAAASLGASIETHGEPEDGHYGDGNWHGADIVSVPGSDTFVYWIER